MGSKINTNNISAGELLRQAEIAKGALISGAVKVPFQSKFMAANDRFISLLQAQDPTRSMGEILGEIPGQVKKDNFLSGLYNFGSWVGYLTALASLLVTALGDAGGAGLLAMLGAGIGSHLASGASDSREQAAKNGAELKTSAEEWTEALQQPALQGVSLRQLMEPALDAAFEPHPEEAHKD